jgi:hypothetical protein
MEDSLKKKWKTTSKKIYFDSSRKTTSKTIWKTTKKRKVEDDLKTKMEDDLNLPKLLRWCTHFDQTKINLTKIVAYLRYSAGCTLLGPK